MDAKTLKKIATKETEKLQDLLMVDAELTVTVEDGDEGMQVITVSFGGEDLGYMIGSHGRHLMSLQYILGNIIRKQVMEEDKEAKIAVLVDVGGYREQQKEKVERLALQKADDARILGEPIDLMPMNASDRRVVHTVLGKFDDIKTESFGEDRERFVRITPLTEKELGITSETEDNESGEEEESEQ
jgi:spoIIIJ-associated protein